MPRFRQGLPPNTGLRPLTPTPRAGCLGCLPRLLLILALGCVLILAITAAFAPWGFYLGGRFHWIPYWQGWGTLHAKSGNYVVFVRFEPKPGGRSILPSSHLGGTAYLCSPRKEIFRMTLGGGMRRGLGLYTDGEKISLYMFYRPAFFGNFTGDRRPSVELRGQWHNPNIVMDDHSSLYRAFEPDGTVYRRHDQSRPYLGEVVPVTLTPGSYSDFEAACKASK